MSAPLKWPDGWKKIFDEWGRGFIWWKVENEYFTVAQDDGFGQPNLEAAVTMTHSQARALGYHIEKECKN